MPYHVKKSGKGYKVFKKGSSKSYSKKPLTKSKAHAQMRALYANESIETQGETLEYFKLWKYPKANEYHTWFKLGSGKDILFTLVFSAGETMNDVDYIETRVTDPGLPAIQIFEDPQSEEAQKILSQYGLTGDDIENAGQESYEHIGRYVPQQKEEQKENLQDSLQFEKYVVSILGEKE